MHSDISYSKVLDRVAPIKHVRMKQRSEPLMDGHILDLINQRDQALHNFRKSKIADHLKHFSKLRNKVQYSFRKAKRHFYNNKIEDHKNSSSDFWKALISLGTSSKLKSGSTSIGLDVDGSTTSDKLKVADTFNEFLTTVANKLVSICRRQSTFSTAILFINIKNRKKCSKCFIFRIFKQPIFVFIQSMKNICCFWVNILCPNHHLILRQMLFPIVAWYSYEHTWPQCR